MPSAKCAMRAKMSALSRSCNSCVRFGSRPSEKGEAMAGARMVTQLADTGLITYVKRVMIAKYQIQSHEDIS